MRTAMKVSRYDGLTLQHRLQNRSTPHSTTNQAPCELFLGRKVRTRLDLLRRDVEDHVFHRQAQQQDQHDMHARPHEFQLGSKVMPRLGKLDTWKNHPEEWTIDCHDVVYVQVGERGSVTLTS